MICPECKKLMKEDILFFSIRSGESWKERKGIKFICQNHTYTTEIIIATENEVIKGLLRTNNWLLDKIILLFCEHSITIDSIIKKKFK